MQNPKLTVAIALLSAIAMAGNPGWSWQWFEPSEVKPGVYDELEFKLDGAEVKIEAYGGEFSIGPVADAPSEFGEQSLIMGEGCPRVLSIRIDPPAAFAKVEFIVDPDMEYYPYVLFQIGHYFQDGAPSYVCSGPGCYYGGYTPVGPTAEGAYRYGDRSDRYKGIVAMEVRYARVIDRLAIERSY